MKLKLLIGLIGLFLIGACTSVNKARIVERERAAQSKGLFCEFVSESDFKDIDIELSLRMAKRCDGSKPFTTSTHKRTSEDTGILYCCNITNANHGAESTAVGTSAGPADDDQKEANKESGKESVKEATAASKSTPIKDASKK